MLLGEKFKNQKVKFSLGFWILISFMNPKLLWAEQRRDQSHLLLMQNSPSEDFLYFLDNEHVSGTRFYLKNPHLCLDTKVWNANKNLICSALKIQDKVQSYDRDFFLANTETDVIFFGEGHRDLETQLEFSRLLKSLKAQGFSTLALEMFPKSTQKYLDQYSQGQISLDQIVAVLEDHWFYNSFGYREILQQARTLNMKIIGIDDRQNITHPDLWINVALRDTFMAESLAEYIGKTFEKVVVYSGKMHAVKSFGRGHEEGMSQKLVQLFDEQKKYQIRTENILFFRADISDIYQDIFMSESDFTNQNLLVKNSDYSYIADGIIYLTPQLNSKLNPQDLLALASE